MSEGARAFYCTRVPEQFNRLLDQELARGGANDPLCRGLTAVDETLAIRVEGPADGYAEFFLNIRSGRMSADPSAERTPFLTLVHDLEALETLESEAGDSALGFLAGLAGLGGEIRLTRARIESLKAIEGSLRFSVVGGKAFSLLSHFGPGPIPGEPDCGLEMDEEVYRELRAGRIGAEDAFMTGRVDIHGDMQMAMQLAVAVLSAD